MNACGITNNSDLKSILEKVWNSAQGVEATQDLKGDVVLEQFYENTYTTYAVKTASGWQIEEGPPPKSATMRIFYVQDACEKLSQVKDFDEFCDTLLDVITERTLTFIPLRPPDMLIEVGFGEFAERVGLPGK